MRLTAADLKELKVIEEIICEPEVYREDTMVMCSVNWKRRWNISLNNMEAFQKNN